MRERSTKLTLWGTAAAAVVVALSLAWIAGLVDRSDPPEGAIAEDSVTIAVGERGPLEHLGSPVVLGLAVAIIALAAAGIGFVRRRRHQASSPATERSRDG